MSALDALPERVSEALPRERPGGWRAVVPPGRHAYAIFGIERGRLRRVRHTVDGRCVVLHTARAGGLFAEAALFSAAYHCDAMADTPARVRAH